MAISLWLLVVVVVVARLELMCRLGALVQAWGFCAGLRLMCMFGTHVQAWGSCAGLRLICMFGTQVQAWVSYAGLRRMCRHEAPNTNVSERQTHM